jgi:4-amino-4-deoxy-L-arabinose transferase-like glycosyltransferase
VLALLMYMPIFGNLNTLPIRIWDEGRIAINACEMHMTGNFIVTTFNFRPDMWNTKPPMLVWCMVSLMKIVGVNELAVRLPSAFAAFFTCLALLLFARRYFKDDWIGFITVLVLITTNGYIHYHVSRTGDYDALLTLFTTVSCLYFYTYCETKQTRYLYLFFICLTLAVLTKGIAGLLFSPALFLFCLIRKKLMLFFLNKHFYIGMMIFLFFGVGYYFLRDHYNPGYLKAIQENELGGRYLQKQGDQDFDFWFYFHNLLDRQFTYWIFLLPGGFILGFISKNQRVRRLTIFLTLLIFTFFIIVSAGQTRLEQYIAPLFPFLALTVALFLHYVFKFIGQLQVFKLLMHLNIRGREVIVSVAPWLFLLMVFFSPYQKVWDKTYNIKEDFWWENNFYEIGNFFKQTLKGHFDVNGKYLLYNGYNAHVLFYVYALQDRGVNTIQRQDYELRPGETLIVYQDEMKKMLSERYQVSVTHVYGAVDYYHLQGER